MIAASKGGVGKSILCAALGAHIASLGEQVNLVDAPPSTEPRALVGAPYVARQPSVHSGWQRARPVGDDPGGPSEGWHGLGDRASAWLTRALRSCHARGDLVVIPVRASMMDIEAVNPICELADEAGVPRVFVINDTSNPRNSRSYS